MSRKHKVAGELAARSLGSASEYLVGLKWGDAAVHKNRLKVYILDPYLTQYIAGRHLRLLCRECLHYIRILERKLAEGVRTSTDKEKS